MPYRIAYRISQILAIDSGAGSVRSLCWSPCGRMLLAAAGDAALVFRAATGQPVARLQGHSQQVHWPICAPLRNVYSRMRTQSAAPFLYFSILFKSKSKRLVSQGFHAVVGTLCRCSAARGAAPTDRSSAPPARTA